MVETNFSVQLSPKLNNDGMLHGPGNKLLQSNTYYWKPNITRNSPMFNFPFHTSPLSANLIRKDLEYFQLNQSDHNKINVDMNCVKTLFYELCLARHIRTMQA